MAVIDTTPQVTETRAARMIREAFESGRPITYIHSAEEQRVASVLAELSPVLLASGCTPVFTWSLTAGMCRAGQAAEAGTETPRGALDFIVDYPDAAIFHLKDFHDPLRESAEIRRRFRDVYDACLDRRKFVVITSPIRFVPEGIERNVLFLDLRPPDAVELLAFVRQETAQSPAGTPGDDILYQVARALQGLTLDEARYAMRRALAGGRPLGPESLPALLEEKRLLVNRGGVIEFITSNTGMGEIGGLEGLKQWLGERRKLFQMRDQISAEIVPKALLLMGIPGCGPTLAWSRPRHLPEHGRHAPPAGSGR